MEHLFRNQVLADILVRALDHYFGFVFITDGCGEILYLNQKAAQCMGTTLEETLRMNCYELESSGMVSHSVCAEVIRSKKKETAIITYPRTGCTIIVVCVPVFDDDGKLCMTVAFSQTENEINDIVKNLEKERRLAKSALTYMEANLVNNSSVVVESPIAKRAFEYAELVAPTTIPVMLQGETGTGKEVMAHFIHSKSNRCNESFIPVNCSAIPHELMEAEFFGYAKGSFTGANRDGRFGIFDMANHGTLFLDEVGELPLDLQPKLLRVLENGSFSRVGSTVQQSVDVRIITATNRNLKDMVEQGSFREDLYYRLNAMPIRIPPLRQRSEDILALSQMFLANYNRKYQLNRYLSQQTKEQFLHYSWPGNIRELRNVLERMVIISPTDELCISEIFFEENCRATGEQQVTLTERSQYSGTLKEQIRAFERDVIQGTLKECEGDVSRAAQRLGISRSNLYQKKLL